MAPDQISAGEQRLIKTGLRKLQDQNQEGARAISTKRSIEKNDKY
jgi:hypothetical protein